MHGSHSLSAEGTKNKDEQAQWPPARSRGPRKYKLEEYWVLGRENTKIASILRREIPGESKGFVLLSASLPPPVLSWPLMATGASLLSSNNFPTSTLFLALLFFVKNNKANT